VGLATPKGDATVYDRVVQESQTGTDPELKEAALSALTRFEDPALVRRTLDYALSNAVRTQDSWMLISLLLAQPASQDAAWAWVQQSWDAIARKSTGGSGARIIEAAGAFCTVERRDEVAAFFTAHPVAGYGRILARTEEQIDACVRLRGRQEPELRQWLATH
jgi:aminopeptidase N